MQISMQIHIQWTWYKQDSKLLWFTYFNFIRSILFSRISNQKKSKTLQTYPSFFFFFLEFFKILSLFHDLKWSRHLIGFSSFDQKRANHPPHYCLSSAGPSSQSYSISCGDHTHYTLIFSWLPNDYEAVKATAYKYW